MIFRSILATGSDIEEVAAELVDGAGSSEADLAVLFVSHHYDPRLGDLLHQVHSGINVRNLIGCTGESIIGPDREVEGQPAAVLWLASMPDVRVLPFLIDQEDLHEFEDVSALIDRVGATPEDDPSFVILAEPFTFDILTGLKYLDEAYPNRPKVGGLASGADEPGQNRLFINDQELRQGLVGVALTGPVRIDTVVSQGCRPVGDSFVVTKAHDNIIEELGGQKPYDVLRQVYMEAASEDQALMQRGLHVGVMLSEHSGQSRPSDFLINNLLGVYEESKLAIGYLIRPGQKIQFHVRDASSADADMQSMLQAKRDHTASAPTGGLLFNCNGRGRRLFAQDNHDIALVNQAFDSCQVAGFFAQGEIGPVGGKTFVHGFTSSLILFQEAKH